MDWDESFDVTAGIEKWLESRRTKNAGRYRSYDMNLAIDLLIEDLAGCIPGTFPWDYLSNKKEEETHKFDEQGVNGYEI